MFGSNGVFFVYLQRLLNFMDFDKKKEVEDNSNSYKKDNEKRPSKDNSSNLFYFRNVNVFPNDLIRLWSLYELDLVSSDAEYRNHQILCYLNSEDFLFVFLGINCDDDFLTYKLVICYHFVKAEVSFFIICG